MATDKIALVTVEQTMSDYVNIYKPLYALFLGGKSVQYSADTGKLNFRRVSAMGDIRQKRITPKDTEIKQISAGDSSKTFRKYFFANQYVVSELQDQSDSDQVVQQVLDEHQLQMDEILMTGDGTSPSDILNNGLYYSQDDNYVLNTSKPIANITTYAEFHAAVVAAAAQANDVPGKKIVMLYGESIISLYDGVYPATQKTVKEVLESVLGPEYSVVKVPKAATPAGALGFIIANMDQTKFHYTLLPVLANQGYNDEKMYYWYNFKMGSVMLEVLVKGAVIRQPLTITA